jgi:uncharacterized protein
LADPRYPLLNPRVREEARAGLCALAVMAKAPRAGAVKTRLSPPLSAEEAAALSACFLRDTAENIASVAVHPTDEDLSVGTPASDGGSMGLVCYTPVGEESAFEGLLPDGFGLIAQRGDGFGERLLAAADDILSCGFGAVCLIDSDSPTLPSEALREAVRELARPGDRVVLGGSEDGGYYLIGLKQAHACVFDQIAWSTASVYAETLERVRTAGLELVELPRWYDVDDEASFVMLEQELLLEERPAFADSATPDGYDARWTRDYLAERLRALEVDAEERA